MKDISYYLRLLKKQTLLTFVRKNVAEEYNDIAFLKCATRLSADTLYMVDAADSEGMNRLISVAENITVFVSGVANATQIKKNFNASIVLTDLTAEQLYTAVNSLLRPFIKIRAAIKLGKLFKLSPQNMTDLLAKEAGVSIFVLNEENKVFCTGNSAATSDSFARELRMNPYLSDKSFAALFGGEIPTDIKNLRESKGPGNVSRCVLTGYAAFGRAISFLMIAQNRELREAEFVADMLSEFFESCDPELLPDYETERILLARILDGSIDDQHYVRQIIGAEEPGVEICLMVVRSDAASKRQRELGEALKKMFNKVRLVHYNGYIVLFLPCVPVVTPVHVDRVATRLSLFAIENPYATLNTTLAEYNAVASLFVPTDGYKKLPAVFFFCAESINISEALAETFRTSHRRFIYPEEYCIWFNLGCAVRYFVEKYGTEALSLMLYPDAATVIKRSLTNDDGTLMAIRCFATDGGNINRAARKCHTHRNTMYNKIKNTENLLNISFDTPSMIPEFNLSLELFGSAASILGIDSSKIFNQI